MRQLKEHEKKLLRKVNLHDWKKQRQHHLSHVVRRYCLDDPEDYQRYSRLCGLVTSLVARLTHLSADDAFRIKVTEQMLEKLYQAGIISNNNDIHAAQKLTVAAFCRRRLPVMLRQLKFAQSARQATTYVQQGHVRVGVDVQTDPAFLVSRQMQDHINWTASSSLRKKVREFRNERDDYE